MAHEIKVAMRTSSAPSPKFEPMPPPEEIPRPAAAVGGRRRPVSRFLKEALSKACSPRGEAPEAAAAMPPVSEAESASWSPKSAPPQSLLPAVEETAAEQQDAPSVAQPASARQQATEAE